MRTTRLPFVVLSCAILAACSTPIAVVGSHAMVLHGTLTAAPDRIALEVTDGKLTCSGSHQGLMIGDASVLLNVTCSDGRKGVADIEGSGSHPHGHMHLEDGTDAEIITNIAN